MKTEFLIPFELDTSALEAKIQADGYKEVIQSLTNSLRREVDSHLPKRFGNVDWDRVIWQAVERFLDKHADEIIDITVLLLAQKVGNRKRWRDVLREIKEERREE